MKGTEYFKLDQVSPPGIIYFWKIITKCWNLKLYAYINLKFCFKKKVIKGNCICSLKVINSALGNAIYSLITRLW